MEASHTWNQVSCLSTITPCWVMSESVSHLTGHIPYEIGSQVTQRRPRSAKCVSAMPLFLNCWQVLPHFAVWRPIRGCCWVEPAVWLAYHSGLLPTANRCPTLSRWFHCRKCWAPASGFGDGHPRSHCPVRLWKTQGHWRDKVRILVTHKHQSGEVFWQQPRWWRWILLARLWLVTAPEAMNFPSFIRDLKFHLVWECFKLLFRFFGWI